MKKGRLLLRMFSPHIFLFLVFCYYGNLSAQPASTYFRCGDIIFKPTRVIRIQNDEKSPDKIKLVDEVGCPAYTLKLLSGQDVEWQIDGSSIKSIDSIVIKEKIGNENIFERQPHKQHLSKHWKGKSKNVTKITTEEYNLLWTDSRDRSFTYDPIMQLNPK